MQLVFIITACAVVIWGVMNKLIRRAKEKAREEGEAEFARHLSNYFEVLSYAREYGKKVNSHYLTAFSESVSFMQKQAERHPLFAKLFKVEALEGACMEFELEKRRKDAESQQRQIEAILEQIREGRGAFEHLSTLQELGYEADKELRDRVHKDSIRRRFQEIQAELERGNTKRLKEFGTILLSNDLSDSEQKAGEALLRNLVQSASEISTEANHTLAVLAGAPPEH